MSLQLPERLFNQPFAPPTFGIPHGLRRVCSPASRAQIAAVIDARGGCLLEEPLQPEQLPASWLNRMGGARVRNPSAFKPGTGFTLPYVTALRTFRITLSPPRISVRPDGRLNQISVRHGRPHSIGRPEY